MSTARNNNTCVGSASDIETGATPADAVGDNGQSLTWVDRFNQLSLVLTGSLLRLCYYFIDIILLSLGLYYGTKTCSVSNSLTRVSISILVFSGLELTSILIFSVINWPSRRTLSVDGGSSYRYAVGYIIRTVFRFLKLICICIGTIYVFKSKVPINDDCEILRFYLGIVCFSTWLLVFISTGKPLLPIRRSLILEIFIFLIVLIYYSINFGLVAFPLMKTQAPECVYTRIEDLYFRAPLKSFAYVGLTLIGCIISTNILNAIFHQLFYRLSHYRRVFLHLSAIIFVISYLEILVGIYYYSVGAMLLFEPRSGGPCRAVAPKLYTALYIWQFIPFLAPLIIWVLAVLLSCLGIMFGACLARCLPASIAVPLFEMLRRNGPEAPIPSNPNPPASPSTIDALPIVVFGQASDEFNQSECTICRADYEANEEIKRLPCGHLFHKHCVAHWLAITRICPVCRERIVQQSL